MSIEKQHHEKRSGRMAQFLARIIPSVSKSVVLYVAIYALYIAAVSAGVSHTFGNAATDPMMAPNQTETVLRYNNLDASVKLAESRMNHWNKRSPLAVSGEVKGVFNGGVTQKQQEILSTLDFEFRSKNLSFVRCPACSSDTLQLKPDSRECYVKCADCVKNKHTQAHFVKENMLPFWYDRDGKMDFSIPDELKDLSFGEKLLIQKTSVLIPVVHLKNGRLGIKGHTCMFRKDLASVCADLPRKNFKVINVVHEYATGSTDEASFTHQTFKVRRDKVLKALLWLKFHHSGYTDIIINEDNLDWMCGKDEDTLSLDNVDISDHIVDKQIQENQNETVATLQTDPSIIDADDMAMEFNGVAMEQAQDTYNRETKELIESLTGDIAKTGCDAVPVMMFPQVSEDPIDEYSQPHIFANAYPWLFPGGFGDCSSTICHDKTGAMNWCRMLIRFSDGRFMRDPVFSFHLLNFVQRHVNNKDAIYFVNRYLKDKIMTIEDIRSQIENKNFDFVHKIQQYAGTKIRGSDGWWRHRRHELDSWIGNQLELGHGPPTLFMTFSCAEYWWKDLENLLLERCTGTEDEELANIMVYDTNEKKRMSAKGKLLESYSAVVQEFFQHRMDAWMETVGKEVFNITHYWLRFEFAKGRGQIHSHMVCITSDYEFIADFHNEFTVKRNKHQGAKIYADYARNTLSLTAEKPVVDESVHVPDKPLSDTFHNTKSVLNDAAVLVENVHMHKCNDYCLRYVKR